MTYRNGFSFLIGVLGLTPFLAQAAPFTLQNVIALVQDPRLGVTRIEQLLDHVPAFMRTHYVLMKESHSTQEASAESPRAILFNEDASLVLAFNGSPTQRGFRTLEAFQYDPSSRSYDFRRILFPEGQTHPVRPQVSEKNPGACAGCHTSGFRPNWEPYPVWPGAIGESFRTYPGDASEIYLERFIRIGAWNSRYAKLNRQQNLDVIRTGLPTTMADRLATQLDKQKRSRLAAKLVQSADYARFKYAIVGALSACPNFDAFVPARAQWRFALSPKNILAETRDSFAKNLHPEHRALLNDRESEAYANFRWLMEGRGISMEGWSYSNQDPYFFSSVAQVDIAGLLQELVRLDRQLATLAIPTSQIGLRFIDLDTYRELFQAKNDPVVFEFCDRLQAASLRSL